MILNLTQHAASPEQVALGVVDLTGPHRVRLIAAITVDTLPTSTEIWARAKTVAAVVAECRDSGMQIDACMLGGAPWMMALLEDAIRKLGIQPVYAFSVRESIEQVQPDGSVRKTAVFRHAGWIEA